MHNGESWDPSVDVSIEGSYFASKQLSPRPNVLKMNKQLMMADECWNQGMGVPRPFVILRVRYVRLAQ
jgi:hypothetical protein